MHRDDIQELDPTGAGASSASAPQVHGGDTRRRFLRLGGGGVLAAAVLAACGSDEEAPPSETGVTTPEQATTTVRPAQTTTPEEGATQDAVVTRTHRAFELAAVQIYSVLLSDEADLADVNALFRLRAPIDYGADTRSALELLRERHRTHAVDLVGVVAAAGGEPVSEPNRGVIEGLLAPRVASLTTERSVLQLLESVESTGTSTYAWGAGTLSTDSLRQDLATVGAVAGRQAALISILLEPTGAGAVPAAVIDTSGPARLPEQMLVLEGQDGDATAAEPPDPSAAAEDEGAGGG